jgi:ABC-type nickel/cobalt efflux system permease component RcnA
VLAAEGFEVGLLATAFGFGLRHGIDWDHLAAITDITSSQEDGRRSMVLAGLYAIGHAIVVLVLGVAAIAAGDRLPDGVDAAMGRVVGATLLLLGAYVFWSLARDGRDFRLRSRWMLVLAGAVRLTRRLRHVVVEHAHDHPADGHHHHDEHAQATSAAHAVPVRVKHAHVHRHVGTLPDDPFAGYGNRTALAVGALHGIGAETPTQVLLFVAAAGVAGTGGGLLMLLAFVAGLLVTNTAIALASTFGFLQAGRSWQAYVAVAVLTGAASVVLGVMFLLGRDSALPTL